MGGEKLLGVVAIQRQATIKTEFRANRRHLPQVAQLHRSHWPAQESVFPTLHAQPATDPRRQQPHGSSPYPSRVHGLSLLSPAPRTEGPDDPTHLPRTAGRFLSSLL